LQGFNVSFKPTSIGYMCILYVEVFETDDRATSIGPAVNYNCLP